METILEIENVVLLRGGTQIIRNASARFSEGSATFFLGPSGSGKSTLLKIAAGIIPPENGKVYYRGTDIFHMSESENKEFRRRNGFVFQDGALWANRSIFENLSLPLEYNYPGLGRGEIRRRIEDAIEQIGFRDDPQLRPAQLSGGERKMIGFMRALMTDPDILFLDTPTENVDANIRVRIRSIIQKLKREGKTLLISSHDKELISSVADDLVVLDTGSILSQGALREVLSGEDEKIKEIIGTVVDADSILGDDLLKLLSPDDENPFDL
ncbi:ATP-binding cassette domain-containing protein [Marispirochaeta sp.]|jgi:ABC-type multidrug transport system ATPase subunit|uniref:ABC transporter ATP-binding protein n=1 Tax=Marispirochaeta sp. TaxID=2038653 RepID=UPI0029C7CE7E|nr:ATP-binding cassette domain-containing protein [Marispirochaeta sp.]